MRKQLLQYCGCALVAGGALALLSYGYLQVHMLRVQREAAVTNANDKFSGPASAPRAIVILPPHEGEAIGRIEIPRLSLSTAVLEGTAPEILRVAVGHIRGTALPGVRGNAAFAGHRDTLFRPLRGVKAGDEILMTTSYGKFRYVVDSTEIVNPTDVRVLRPTPDAELTLVTCYPFSYIGAAPQRFIVHARQQL
jgi:sortase A